MARRAERFWDRIAARYAARPIRDPAAYERTLARTRAWLPPGAQVLELGCGTGTKALRLADAAGRITASDFSGAMIAIAEAKARAEGAAAVSFVRADALDPAALPGPCDAVLAFNFLQLMADLPVALDAVARRLRPGGLFVSKSVCLGEAGWRKARLIVGALKAVGVAPPIRFMTIGALDAAVTAAGFEIPERGVFPESPPGRFLIARKAGGA